MVDFNKFKNASLNDMSTGKYNMLQSAKSCIGCDHRRGHGDKGWCANQSIPVQMRPMGAAMRGCDQFVTGSKNRGHTPVSVSLARIASRRSSR